MYTSAPTSEDDGAGGMNKHRLVPIIFLRHLRHTSGERINVVTVRDSDHNYLVFSPRL